MPLPCSMRAIVARPTLEASARSSCRQPRSARAARFESIEDGPVGHCRRHLPHHPRPYSGARPPRSTSRPSPTLLRGSPTCTRRRGRHLGSGRSRRAYRNTRRIVATRRRGRKRLRILRRGGLPARHKGKVRSAASLSERIIQQFNKTPRMQRASKPFRERLCLTLRNPHAHTCHAPNAANAYSCRNGQSTSMSGACGTIGNATLATTPLRLSFLMRQRRHSDFRHMLDLAASYRHAADQMAPEPSMAIPGQNTVAPVFAERGHHWK